ncbi:MAG: hypothetical protein ABFQ95_00970 [Pseudomonadota bacterium]
MTQNNENIKIVDEGNLRQYRTEIPNIVEEYLSDPYEFRVYCHLKRRAGDSGACTESRSKMAKKCGMGIEKLRKVLISLSMLNPKFENLPLIMINKRKTEKGDPDTDFITIIDLWNINFKIHFSPPPESGGVPHETGEGTPRDGGGVPHEVGVKKEPFKEDKKEKEQKERKKKGRKNGAKAPCVSQNPSSFPQKSSFGSDGKVKMTEVEYNKLFTEWGKGNLEDLVEQLNDYIGSSGKRYKSHYHTLRQWHRKRSQEKPDPRDRRTKNVDGTAVDSPVDGLF